MYLNLLNVSLAGNQRTSWFLFSIRLNYNLCRKVIKLSDTKHLSNSLIQNYLQLIKPVMSAEIEVKLKEIYLGHFLPISQ